MNRQPLSAIISEPRSHRKGGWHEPGRAQPGRGATMDENTGGLAAEASTPVGEWSLQAVHRLKPRLPCAGSDLFSTGLPCTAGRHGG